MIDYPIRMEGFILTFFLILTNPKVIVKHSTVQTSNLTIYNRCYKKMSIYKGTYELVDISSSDEERILERASTPLPRCEIPNYRVVLEVPHSPTEATVGDEEYFDLSLESLESDCRRMKLNLSYESIEFEESPETELALENLREGYS